VILALTASAKEVLIWAVIMLPVILLSTDTDGRHN
jgi:hypothetical protein